MAYVKLNGDTSGFTLIAAPAVSKNNTLTLPTVTDTLVTQNGATLNNATLNSPSIAGATLTTSTLNSPRINTPTINGFGLTSLTLTGITTASGTSIFQPVLNNIAFSTANTERMRLVNPGGAGYGNLLIGTATAPANGTAALVINHPSGGGAQFVNNNSGGGNVSALSGGGLAFSIFTGAVGSEVITEALRVTSTGNLSVTGHVLPNANLTYSLGSTAQRWSVVYTGDLSLKNELGDWTIVEGDDDLFIYNNKRNRVYKFNLTEVDPATAPPKKDA